MCGIAAVITSDPPAGLADVTLAMTNELAHRGPDDVGVEAFEPEGVALGMRRLSILDLEGGAQPMWDEERRHAVVFNGEIYNFAELRRELAAAGHVFATDHSDTEVLVHGYEEWGAGLCERLNGMFAFAVWDRARERLFVARDPAGEKPLYVARVRGGFAVASELKALLRYPALHRAIDHRALEQYLDFGYVLAPRTILADVTKLPAGHLATVTARSYDPSPYWTPKFQERDASEDELLEEFDALLDDSVARRMVADVPVGLLLSGGLDSTTIGWYMRRHSDDVRSFSIGFEEAGYDEAHFSALAAEHLGTTHRLEVLSQSRALELVPKIPEILDEPMADQSIFPTYLLSVVTRQDVKVALGGDGSDELLMGYTVYPSMRRSDLLANRLPGAARGAVAAVARRLPTSVRSTRLRGVRAVQVLDRGPAGRTLSYFGHFQGDARSILAPSTRRDLGPSVFDGVEEALLGDQPRELGTDNRTIAAVVRSYLQDDILVKTDRASMAASLELRAPFLDPRLIEFFLSVPPSLKLRNGTPKYLLHRLMAGRIPAAITARKKHGFDLPLGQWLRDSLAPVVREYLSEERVGGARRRHPAAVKRIVETHLDGRADRGREVWLLLQLELWRARWLD
jgi:asparagine synthase (glutamine-hydrolysing)